MPNSQRGGSKQGNARLSNAKVKFPSSLNKKQGISLHSSYSVDSPATLHTESTKGVPKEMPSSVVKHLTDASLNYKLKEETTRIPQPATKYKHLEMPNARVAGIPHAIIHPVNPSKSVEAANTVTGATNRLQHQQLPNKLLQGRSSFRPMYFPPIQSIQSNMDQRFDPIKQMQQLNMLTNTNINSVANSPADIANTMHLQNVNTQIYQNQTAGRQFTETPKSFQESIPAARYMPITVQSVKDTIGHM